MKKRIFLALCGILAATLAGCGRTTAPETTVPAETVIETSELTLPETTVPAIVPDLPPELADYGKVFDGTQAIYRTASMEPIMISKISLFFTVDELPWDVVQIAVQDMDSDAVLEAVLEVANSAGYVILDYQDGTVLGREAWYRAFQELKADGSYMGSSSSFNRYYWQYHPDGDILLAERYEMDNGDPYYSVSGDAVDADTFAAFEAVQNAKPAATWYPSWEDYLESR